MGSNLRRQLREALPPSIKGLQRAVALEIADDARYNDAGDYDPENGRRSKVRLAELVRWTAAKDELSVREMLRRLSLAGWEFRLPIGKDKNGNVMYAVPGKAMTFRVPDFEGPTTVGPYVETETEGPTTVGGRANHGWAMAQPPLGVPPTTVGPGPTTVGPPSPVSSFSTKDSPSSSPVAEVADSGNITDVVAEEGGGGGNLDSSEDQEDDKPIARAEAFVDSLDYRGKQLGQTRRAKLAVRVAAAFKDGWTENGLRRYLDISDDPAVRTPASVYAHRLKEDELPEAAPVIELPPPCNWCRIAFPTAGTDASVRKTPLGDPCPECHPTSVAQKATVSLPPPCESCQQQPGADTNPNVRLDPMSFTGALCPRCHPDMVGGTGARSTPHTADAYTSTSVDDLFAPRRSPLPGDRNVNGWMDVADSLGREQAKSDQRVQQAIDAGRRLQAKAERLDGGPKPMVAPVPYQPYSDPEDQSVYDEPL